MLANLVNLAKQNSETSGNHIQYEISGLAAKMSIDEIDTLAKEIDNKRLNRQVAKYHTGEWIRSQKGQLNHIRQMVSGQIEGQWHRMKMSGEIS